jgi:hypothetical protein
MDLEATVKDAKKIARQETVGYRGSAKNMVANGIKAAAGVMLAVYFDSEFLELVCGGYGALKAWQCYKDFRSKNSAGAD